MNRSALVKEISSNMIDFIKLKTVPEKKRPDEVGLLVTENCIFRCQTCVYWRTKKREQSLDKIKYIIDQSAEFGIKKLSITGGEPLLRKDIVKIIKHGKDYGMRVHMVTNGWLMKPEIVKDLDFVAVSIDGVDAETHDRIRNTKGAFERACKALKILQELGIMRAINFVVQKENYEQIPDIMDFAKNNFDTSVNYLFYNTGGMGQPNPKIKEHREFDLDLLEKKIDEMIRKHPWQAVNLPYYRLIMNKLRYGCDSQKCIVPHCKFMINCYGDVHICAGYPKPIDNIFKKPLEEIWKENGELRKKIREGKDPNCIPCYSCELLMNVHKNIPQAFNIGWQLLKYNVLSKYFK